MQELVGWISQYGIIILFVIIYFESLGAPLPGETALVASSVLAATGQLELRDVLIYSFLAAVLGDCTGFAIGRYGGRAVLIRYGRYVRLTEKRLEKFDRLMSKSGFYFVTIARFIVVARQLNGVIAGSGNMPFVKFLIANIIGALAWVAVWGAGPYIVKIFF